MVRRTKPRSIGDIHPNFRIASDVYADAFQLIARSFYGQRCGTAIDLGGSFHHEACHKVGAYDSSSGQSGPRPSLRGWHDAGPALSSRRSWISVSLITAQVR